MDVNEELKFLEKFIFFYFFFLFIFFFFLGGGGGGGVGLGGQDGCERRIEVFVKIKKKMEGGGVVGSGWLGGQGG